MFAKDMTVGYLLDFYGGMLSERTRAILEQYYGDDLSLGEIAESFGISRQGVRHVVKKAEESLRFWENTLGLAGHFSHIKEAIGEIRNRAASLSGHPDGTVRDAASGISSFADQILTEL